MLKSGRHATLKSPGDKANLLSQTTIREIEIADYISYTTPLSCNIADVHVIGTMKEGDRWGYIDILTYT